MTEIPLPSLLLRSASTGSTSSVITICWKAPIKTGKGWKARCRSTIPCFLRGNYVFKVRARNEGGYHSPHITSLRIIIRPPFWRDFLVLWTGGAGDCRQRSIISIALRIRRLLQVEKIRTRLARDLHDDMGSTAQYYQYPQQYGREEDRL